MLICFVLTVYPPSCVEIANPTLPPEGCGFKVSLVFEVSAVLSREKSGTWAVFCIKVQFSNLLQCLLESVYICAVFRVYQDLEGALFLHLCHLCGSFALLALRGFCEFVAPKHKDWVAIAEFCYVYMRVC